MQELEKLRRINEITERLCDQVSLGVFKARLEFTIQRDFFQYWKRIDDLKVQKWRLEDKSFNDENYIVFTAGNSGRQCADVLKRCGKNVLFFVDNDAGKTGKKVDGILIKPIEALRQMPDVKVVSGSAVYAEQLRKQLSEMGVKNKVLDSVCAFTGNQYFDVLTPISGEVFIDAGAYDGGTVLDFIKWHDGIEYDRIYAFEPDTQNVHNVLECFVRNNVEKANLINKGTWKNEAELYFTNNGSSGASFVEELNCTGTKIPVASIDSVMQGKKVTYIKMDVEGSESETLEGAKETIVKWKPRLAVCVYHKPFDVIDLPLQILDMNSDYRFYLRHYASNLCETVLYAE